MVVIAVGILRRRTAWLFGASACEGAEDTAVGCCVEVAGGFIERGAGCFAEAAGGAGVGFGGDAGALGEGDGGAVAADYFFVPWPEQAEMVAVRPQVPPVNRALVYSPMPAAA